MIIYPKSEDEEERPEDEFHDFLNRDEKRALHASETDG
jgi:hypothetical protein